MHWLSVVFKRQNLTHRLSFSLERAIPFEHMMYEHLQKWGPRKQEVKFFLRHEDSPTESSDQGGWLISLKHKKQLMNWADQVWNALVRVKRNNKCVF